MYRIEAASGDVGDAFRNSAESQIQKAFEVLEGESDLGRAVHALRKRCKKLRGLLRLVRPVFRGFARENAALRTAANMLSGTRDADVLSQTLADLIDEDPERAEALAPLRDRVFGGRMPEAEVRAQLADFRLALLEVRERAKDWTLEETGFSAIAPGLRQTYRAARRRMRTALKTRTAADLHEWRKANKNHGFHVEALRKTAPVMLRPEHAGIDRLSELLGKHHDLDVLAATAGRTPDRFGTPEQLRILSGAIVAKLGALEETIMEVGRQTLAESPKALAARYERYWSGMPDHDGAETR